MLFPSTTLRRRLANSNPATLNLFAVSAAFATYFCMYAFRKPFAAATYDGLSWEFLGASLDLKTALVISQIVGYAASKFVGIKVCSEARRDERPWLLVGLIAAAEAALLLFAIVPQSWKPAALLLNGLPLGMVWGLVVQYLEGRRTSEFLLAGLSCSFILSSGVVKDVGRALMFPAAEGPASWFAWLPPVSEFWMPAVTGAIFLPLFLLSVWLLNHLPEPTAADVAERTKRAPMDAASRAQFLRRFFPGIVLLLIAYFFLTAFRDFRDNYMVDVLNEMGDSYAESGASLSRMELAVALVVLATMASLSLVHDNQRGLLAVFAVMIAGVGMLGGATYLRQVGVLSGFWWMTLLGMGSYLAYVPYNSLLFDRLLASTRVTGTAVFAIYVADAAGYVGSILTQLLKDLAWGGNSRLSFLTNLSYTVCGVAALSLAGSCYYFLRRSKPQRHVQQVANYPSLPTAVGMELDPEA
ncbi:MAG: hypothetical protein KDA44_00640 [Planctomycetales bacterium]|nr:hypothetical protein [Planctomycetales bacterium]